jgi:hypothetical protein
MRILPRQIAIERFGEIERMLLSDSAAQCVKQRGRTALGETEYASSNEADL